MKVFFKLLCLILLLSPVLKSQNIKGKNTLNFNLGISLPNMPGEFNDYWKSGINLGSSFTTWISPIFLLSPSILYQSFPINGERLVNDMGGAGYGISVSGGSASAITVFLDAKLDITPSRVTKLFLIWGVGFYNFKIDNITLRAAGDAATAQGHSEDGMGWNIGLAVEFPLSETLRFFVDGRYLRMNTEGEATGCIPIKSGLSFVL